MTNTESISASGTQASFVGDEWHCECGNRPHTSGFYPCLKTGQVVDAFYIDTPLYRCFGCGAIIEYDDDNGCGRIVGKTAPEWLNQTEPL